MTILTAVSTAARKVLPLGHCTAILVAAGSAARMGGIDKVMADLHGRPLVGYSLEAFQTCEAIREIIVVTRPDLVAPISDLARTLGITKLRKVIPGGKTRAESVAHGIDNVSPETKLVAIHDAARPFITPAVIDRTVRAAHAYHAAAPAIAVKDTIKVAPGGVVETTPERKNLYAVQTPQCFDVDAIRGALSVADLATITDDCSAVEQMGMSVKLVEGDEANFKVTTPMDLLFAKALLAERS